MKRVWSVCLILLVAITTQAQWKPDPHDTPAYNAAPPRKGQKLPAILAVERLTGPHAQHPAQAASYRAAAKVPNVLHQLPCYCYCDRGHGHNSLHSCFEDTHGALCGVCMQEALLAEKMTKEGKTVKQIRAAIMKGEFQKINLQAIK
jgi:hypothetical protein